MATQNQSRSHVIDMSELDGFGNSPPSYGEGHQRSRGNDGAVPLSDQISAQQPQQGAVTEKIDPNQYSYASQQPQHHNSNVPVDVIPPEQIQYVTPLENLGQSPQWIDCPFCKRRTQTRVAHEDSSATTLAGVVCCLVCICLTCLPCMMGWFQDTDHYCTECKRKVTHQPHDGPVQVQKSQVQGQQVSAYHYPQGQQPQMQYKQQVDQQQHQSQTDYRASQQQLPPNGPQTQGGLPNGIHQAVPPGVPRQSPVQIGGQQQQQQDAPRQPSMYQSAGQTAPEPARLR